MPERFALLFRQQMDAIARAWVDAVYAERRTELPSILSARELVEYLPDVFDELARILDDGVSHAEITESVLRLRAYAQMRFQQGVLIDEVARELMLLRSVLNRFLWREALDAAEVDVRELRDALRRTNIFVDELIAQVLLIYASCMRPSIRTRSSLWPPTPQQRGRRREDDFPEKDEE
ncbi:MAG TPA: RsbRD N-terminal domain-containing protein [Pyrinomonadaceae bacterium]|jgi:hypothetical protein|nr:RsbRD N-terminal domain-containing protein [Pyrinomonadaceae bacterium]